MSILRLEVGFCSVLSRQSCFHRERRKPPGFSDADRIIEINLDYIQVVRKKCCDFLIEVSITKDQCPLHVMGTSQAPACIGPQDSETSQHTINRSRQFYSSARQSSTPPRRRQSSMPPRRRIATAVSLRQSRPYSSHAPAACRRLPAAALNAGIKTFASCSSPIFSFSRVTSPLFSRGRVRRRYAAGKSCPPTFPRSPK